MRNVRLALPRAKVVDPLDLPSEEEEEEEEGGGGGEEEDGGGGGQGGRQRWRSKGKRRGAIKGRQRRLSRAAGKRGRAAVKVKGSSVKGGR